MSGRGDRAQGCDAGRGGYADAGRRIKPTLIKNFTHGPDVGLDQWRLPSSIFGSILGGMWIDRVGVKRFGPELCFWSLAPRQSSHSVATWACAQPMLGGRPGLCRIAQGRSPIDALAPAWARRSVPAPCWAR